MVTVERQSLGWDRTMKQLTRGLGWGRGGSDWRQHGMVEQREAASDYSKEGYWRTPLLESEPEKIALAHDKIVTDFVSYRMPFCTKFCPTFFNDLVHPEIGQ